MMAAVSGWITDIQRFSLYDGPGIRTTVFLKGCPLRCLWCHNPECLAPGAQLRYLDKRCVSCRRCEAVCPQGVHTFGPGGHHLVDRAKCVCCGQCAQVCPAEALKITGQLVTAQSAMAPVLADKRYYEHSGGGLTISGGEPLFQPDFTLALLTLARENGISTAIETSGCMAAECYLRVLPLTDLFLFDCKETDPARHRAYTGQDNGRILENLDLLLSRGAQVILRCPIIPGLNDRDEHLAGIAALLRRYPALRGCELMAYHKLGAAKYRELGREYQVTAEEFTPAQKDALLAHMNAIAPREIVWG